MIFDGNIELPHCADHVWDFLIDMNKFSACLPGIEEVRQIDDKSFAGVVAATVGPISGKFSFRSTILESRPSEQILVRTEGTDSVTKSDIQADMTVNLHGYNEPVSFDSLLSFVDGVAEDQPVTEDVCAHYYDGLRHHPPHSNGAGGRPLPPVRSPVPSAPLHRPRRCGRSGGRCRAM